MSGENPTQLIQCVGCQAKLRVAVSASGKTIACPKCGQQIKIESNAKPARPLVVARPISSPGAPATVPLQASSIPTPSASTAAPMAGDHNWSNLQIPASGNAYPTYAATPKASNKNLMWLWIALAGGGMGLVLIVGFMFMLIQISRAKSTNKAETIAAAPPRSTTRPVPAPPTFPTASAPAAPIPTPPPGRTVPTEPGRSAPSRPPGAGSRSSSDLGFGMPFKPGIVYHRVNVQRERQRPLTLNIFIPEGEHAEQSLPVMFEAPSGTNLLHGADVGLPRVATEILPFTDEGMITVTFSLDGPIPDDVQPTSLRYTTVLNRAYREFMKSDAGVANGQQAIDYVLEKLPAADPKRLYIWGHSSSATLALLMASKDTRIAKCIALAPITDLDARLGELLTEKSMTQILPNLPDYLKSGSPLTYVRQLKCPVFVAHAQDDDNEPFKNTQAYAEALRQAGGNLTFEQLASGGHYQELLKTSIPKAVEWVKK